MNVSARVRISRVVSARGVGSLCVCGGGRRASAHELELEQKAAQARDKKIQRITRAKSVLALLIPQVDEATRDAMIRAAS